MQLKILNSNSAGNCYILQGQSSCLLIEAGLRFDVVKRGLGFRLNNVAGALITHEHKDHSLSVQAAMAAGIDVYTSAGTCKALGITDHHRAHPIRPGVKIYIGTFKVMAFDVKHDAAEPFGYYIHHPECGNIVFITDTHYVPNTFRGLNNIIVEANYSEAILADRQWEGQTPSFLRNRVIGSHMSIETCLDFLDANDLSQVNNIVLIHLSDSHSDAAMFQRMVAERTGKTVTIADKGLTIPFNSKPF